MSGEAVLTMEDRGQTVSVPSDGIFEVHLPENPTTGMRWSPPNADLFEVLTDTYPPVDEASGVGAATTRIFRFRVRGKNPATLRLEQRQAWEAETPPEAVFEVVVTPEP